MMGHHKLLEPYIKVGGRGYSTPYLRRVAMPDTKCVLKELHEGYTTCHKRALYNKKGVATRVLMINDEQIGGDNGTNM